MQQNLENKFCDQVAPGQEDGMMGLLEAEEEVEEADDSIIKHLQQAFDTCKESAPRHFNARAEKFE